MEDFNMMMIHRMSTYMKPTLLESGKRGSVRIYPDDIDIEGGAGAEIFDEGEVWQKEDNDKYYDQDLKIRVKRGAWEESSHSSSESTDYTSPGDSCLLRRDWHHYRCGDHCISEAELHRILRFFGIRE